MQKIRGANAAVQLHSNLPCPPEITTVEAVAAGSAIGALTKGIQAQAIPVATSPTGTGIAMTKPVIINRLILDVTVAQSRTAPRAIRTTEMTIEKDGILLRGAKTMAVTEIGTATATTTETETQKRAQNMILARVRARTKTRTTESGIAIIDPPGIVNLMKVEIPDQVRNQDLGVRAKQTAAAKMRRSRRPNQ